MIHVREIHRGSRYSPAGSFGPVNPSEKPQIRNRLGHLCAAALRPHTGTVQEDFAFTFVEFAHILRWCNSLFAVDGFECPLCDQPMRLQAVVLPPATLRVLDGLELACRGPPQQGAAQ
jgi:hypothetical protein